MDIITEYNTNVKIYVKCAIGLLVSKPAKWNVNFVFFFSFCNDKKCLDLHQSKICKKSIICDKCSKSKSRNHICENQKFCKNCLMGVYYDHKCYILTESEKECRKKFDPLESLKGYIFYDYEACQIDGIHVPNLVVAEKICFNCININEFFF